MESSPYPRDFNPLESPRACRLLGVLILMLILATIAVVARLASRKVKGAKLWWDDRLAVAALVSVCLILPPPWRPELTS